VQRQGANVLFKGLRKFALSFQGCSVTKMGVGKFRIQPNCHSQFFNCRIQFFFFQQDPTNHAMCFGILRVEPNWSSAIPRLIAFLPDPRKMVGAEAPSWAFFSFPPPKKLTLT